MVVVELFSGLAATTEALLRKGVTIQKVYACELDDKTRKIATRRLAVLHAMFPQHYSVWRPSRIAMKHWATMFAKSPVVMWPHLLNWGILLKSLRS